MCVSWTSVRILSQNPKSQFMLAKSPSAHGKTRGGFHQCYDGGILTKCPHPCTVILGGGHFTNSRGILPNYPSGNGDSRGHFASEYI